MKITHALICLSALLLTRTSLPAYTHKSNGNREYCLVWKENFRGKTFNTESWSKIPRGESDWNRHMSDDERLYDVRNGRLVLRGMSNDGSFRFKGEADTARHVTGGLFTHGKRNIRYGKVEVKAKLGCAQGAWPAFWMLPENGKWPDGGEIDIMEHLNHDTIAYQTIHSHYTYVLKLGNTPPHGSSGPIKSGKFNIYAVEILPDSLILSINGMKTLSYPRIQTDKHGQYPFGAPFYLLIDMQLGGSWVGRIYDGELPVEIEIDWVKMYELAKK
ncbi:MAG: glycoside hydrolase family 16 protein [Bacteroidaceae bacterium]